MYTVLDPYYLFITENEWLDQNAQIQFLEDFLKISELGEKYPPIKICWSGELDEILWSSPLSPPWKYYYSNQLIPLYYKNIFSNRFMFESVPSECVSIPKVDWLPDNEYFNQLYYKLFASIIDAELDFLLYLNAKRVLQSITFYYQNSTFTPNLVSDNQTFFKNVPFVDYYFDLISYDESSLNKCLKLQLEIMGKTDFKLSFTYSDSFIKDISKEQNSRFKMKIIEQLAKRLTMTYQESARDNTLQDEYIKNSKCFRFRVTQRPTSCRIHYVINEGVIHLKNYYSDGEHDDGL